ncbi:ParA family protein [Teichococcus deserti]|uniref:ParA family protein n=1 Tax=Teichococcus deserti TaxID=1817963 RepID=UPI001A979AF2|nr:ParA family protein [Pseudoroseomonas deserti]
MLVVGCASQKGGVAKSSLARLLAREMAAQGQRVLLADLDVRQATSLEWARRRAEAGLRPELQVARCETVKNALKQARQAEVDCLILDARGFADAQTLEVAGAADALLIPSGLAVDDLLPSVRLAHELTRAGIAPARIGVALCRAGDTAGEIAEAARYVAEAGYHCLPVAWPERAGYRRAHDEGRVATEARHPSLRGRAEAFAAGILDFIARQPRLKKDDKHGRS